MKPPPRTVPDPAAHAQLLCEKGLWSEVLAFAKKWHAENPASAQAWFFQGVALVGWGKFAEAETAFRRALALNAENFNTWQQLGYLLSASLHRPADGAKCFVQALQIEPRNKFCWLDLARMHTQLHHHQEALECADRALALDPQMAAAHLQRARAAQALGKMEIVRAASEALATLPAEKFKSSR